MESDPPGIELQVDEDARTRFATDLDTNFCVSAGAGAGKTTAIVRRVAHIAADRPESLPKLVIVTYTRAAANELRQRARASIIGNPALTPANRSRQLAGLRQAFFGTIHSFCLRLVRMHGRWLGLPDDVQLLEDDAGDDCWARFVDSPALDRIGLPPELTAGFLRHETFDSLLKLARAISPAVADQIADLPPPGPPPAAGRAEIEQALALINKKAKKLPGLQDSLRQWIEEYDAGTPFLPLPAFDGGGKEFIASTSAAFAGIREWLAAAGLHLGGRISRAFRDHRTDLRLVSYDDMVYWSRRLVDDPPTLEAIRRRGYSVILDEAQDTDSEMFAVLTEITRPAGAPPHAWPDDSAAPGPDPGRFSFVGDDQQAIFGARADLADYLRYVAAFADHRGGEPLTFSATMRCPKRVIDLVNAAFNNKLVRKEPETRYRRLDPKNGAADGAFQIIPIPSPPEEIGGVDAEFAFECRVVADFLAGRGTGGLGVSSWGEVAILCPRNGWLEAAERILRERGLPVRLLASRLVARESPARSWPTALFHLLANPWDRFELFGVLQEIFGVSGVELADAAAEPGGLHIGSAAPAGSSLARALAGIHELLAGLPQAEGTTLSRFVTPALDRIQLAARLTAAGVPDAAASIAWVAESAAAAECDGLTFSGWAKSLVDRIDARIALPVEDTPEIQLLTCHKAKGQEWPVVIPLGFARPLRPHSATYPIVRTRAGEPSVVLSKDGADPVAVEQEKLASREETLRLLYVTLTRARHALLVPDASDIYGGNGDNAFRGLCAWSDIDTSAVATPRIPVHTASAPAAVAAPLLPALAPSERKAAISHAHAIPQRILPHSLVHDDRFPADRPTEEFDEPVGGIDYGLWWHETFEAMPWPAGRKACEIHLEAALDSLDSRPETRDRAAAEIALFLKSTPCEQLLVQANLWLAEVPFSHPMSSAQWVEGVIDLVALTKDGAVWIIDWKTNRPARGEEPAKFRARLAETYAPQIAAYAAALDAATGRTAAKLRLYATATGEWIELT